MFFHEYHRTHPEDPKEASIDLGWGGGIFNGTTQFWYKVSMLLLQSQAKVAEAASHHWCSPFLFLFTSFFLDPRAHRRFLPAELLLFRQCYWWHTDVDFCWKKILFTIYSCSDVIIWSKVHIWLNNDWIVTIFPLKIWNYVHKVSSCGIKL